MITAVDTNVLLDLFRTDSPFHSRSREWLRRAYDRGAVIVCDLVYAELVPAFPSRISLDAALREIGAALSPVDSSIAYEAGLRWKQYRRPVARGNESSPTFSLGLTHSQRPTHSSRGTWESIPHISPSLGDRKSYSCDQLIKQHNYHVEPLPIGELTSSTASITASAFKNQSHSGPLAAGIAGGTGTHAVAIDYDCAREIS